MCSKSSPVGEEKQKGRSTSNKTRSPDKKKKKKKPRESTSKIPSNLGPSRKIRTKTRKPKYLSLKLELNSTSHDDQTNRSNHKNSKSKNNKRKKKPRNQNKTMTTTKSKSCNTTPFRRKEKEKEQLNLFPLHPDNQTEKEAYGYQYDAVTACLFNSATDRTVSSIHDLLDSSSSAAAAATARITTASDCGGRDLSPYDPRDHGSSSSSLVRTAMRRGASEEAEERWVSYSEVVEEVMSRSGTPRWCGEEGDEDSGNVGQPSLALKLDYQQIMEAWSDKGPLYIDGEPPQTVPDLHAGGYANGLAEGFGGVGSLWAVPEMEEAERLKRGRREASLLRYKEKRQSRLFAKRIRYEVRKLNAEKRPRLKGRFVRRVDT